MDQCMYGRNGTVNLFIHPIPIPIHVQAVLSRGLLVQTWPFLGCPQRPHL